MENDYYTPEKVQQIIDALTSGDSTFLINENEENTDEMVNFYFVGMYEGRKVLYDALIYTLRLHHNSELYELAEHRAAKRFPNYKKIQYEEDENGDLEALDSLEEEIGLFMAEVMMELEDEGAVKVKEHVEVDVNLDNRLGLDIGLNVEQITDEIIEAFIKQFNNDELELDDTLYSFQTEELEDE
jgi:hypothetical protein